jgi:hypothetical protein
VRRGQGKHMNSEMRFLCFATKKDGDEVRRVRDTQGAGLGVVGYETRGWLKGVEMVWR